MEKMNLATPEFEKLADIEVLLSDAYPLGSTDIGYKEITPVKGGKAEGIISGDVLPVGGDWGLLCDGKINLIDTKFIINTQEGENISVDVKGKLIMDMDEMTELCAGDRAEPPDNYFRNAVDLWTGGEKYRWVNEIVAFAVAGVTDEGNVYMEVYWLK